MRWSAPNSRQVNLVLEVALLVCLASGLASWIVPTASARPFTFVHATSAIVTVVLAPRKYRGSIQRGFARRRAGRWVSALFGVMIVGAVVFGTVHSTGLWHGVGTWSPLWIHLALGFGSIPLFGWHVATRPVRRRAGDMDRRAFLTIGAASITSVAAVGVVESAVRAVGGSGGRRAGTGSFEVAAFDPERLPVVSWIDDRIPGDTSPIGWPFTVDGRRVTVGHLASLTSPLVAELDCTGGWRSPHRWDVVALSTLVDGSEFRSVVVASATGYARRFGRRDLDRVFVCTGYDGVPLRPGNGGPLRVVAPGRRGPWWVKWVTTIELSDRPAWLQLPLPPT